MLYNLCTLLMLFGSTAVLWWLLLKSIDTYFGE